MKKKRNRISELITLFDFSSNKQNKNTVKPIRQEEEQEELNPSKFTHAYPNLEYVFGVLVTFELLIIDLLEEVTKPLSLSVVSTYASGFYFIAFCLSFHCI